MITFETEEDFQEAVMCVIAEKLGIRVWVSGDHFVTSVEVALVNNNDSGGTLCDHRDATA